MAPHFRGFPLGPVVVELVVYTLYGEVEGDALVAGESRQQTAFTFLCDLGLELAVVAYYGQLQEDCTIDGHREGVADCD